MSQSVRQAPEIEEVQGRPLETDRPGAPVKVLWGRVAALAAALIAAYLLGRITAPNGVPAEELGRAQNELAAAQERISDLEARLADATSPENARPVTTPAEESVDDPTVPGERDGAGAGTDEAPAGGIPAEEGAEAPATNPDSAETYVVRDGDSLNSIAQDHYGDASFVGLIAEANNITTRRRIQVGQKLELPPKP
jgi:nucleoid-associated protein YgaU